MKKFALPILFAVMSCCAFAASTHAEGLTHFPEQSLMDLTLIETNPELGSFSFVNQSGEVSEGVIGDFVGIENVKIVEVYDIEIIAVTYEKYVAKLWDGTYETRTRTNTHLIPKARVLQGRGGGKGVR